MTQTVIILGVKGRFGRAAAHAFCNAGWRVKGFARNWSGGDFPKGLERIDGDAMDLGALTTAVEGCDVIVHALHPPFPKWTKVMPVLTRHVIAAAKISGATVMIPGNLYNYGPEMPPVLTETTRHDPRLRKSRLRIEMEETFAIAADTGVQTLVVRGGDFIERQKTGNWFDTHMANTIPKGKFTYPGPLNLVHAWAYLPDMARALVGVAELRSELAMFEEFGYEGYNLTGFELIAAVEETIGRKLKVITMPWTAMKYLGVLVPNIREVVGTKYLWDVPHAMDGAKLTALLPDFQPTPLSEAMVDVLA